MASTQKTTQAGLFSPIMVANMPPQDNTMSALNNELQRICAAIQSLQSSSSSASSPASSSGAWQAYNPAPNISGAGMTISGVTAEWAMMLNTGTQLFLNLDLNFTIAGSGPSLLLGLPNVVPANNQFGNVLSCIVYQGGPTPSAGMARVVTVGSTAGIYIYLASGASFAAGATEVVITGFYEV